MRILELERYAQENGFDSVKFKFTDLKGISHTGQWLDAYMGLFIVEGNDGFITVDQWRTIAGDRIEFEVISE